MLRVRQRSDKSKRVREIEDKLNKHLLSLEPCCFFITSQASSVFRDCFVFLFELSVWHANHKFLVVIVLKCQSDPIAFAKYERRLIPKGHLGVLQKVILVIVVKCQSDPIAFAKYERRLIPKGRLCVD